MGMSSVWFARFLGKLVKQLIWLYLMAGGRGFDYPPECLVQKEDHPLLLSQDGSRKYQKLPAGMITLHFQTVNRSKMNV